MLEREPQIPDEALREILGFDPESGERVEDKSGLKEFKTTTFAIPDEIQHEFLNVFEKEGDFSLIYPPKLLTIATSEQGVTKSYYSWQPSDEGRTSFPLVAEAYFQSEGDAFRPTGILFQGEVLPSKLGGFIAGRYIAYEFSAINFRHFDSDLTNFNIALSERLLDIVFSHKGSLIKIDFWMQHKGIAFLDVNGITLANLTEILEKGNFEAKRGINEYKFTVIEDKINLKRIEQSGSKDEILIPISIDRGEIIDELFEPQTLQDPINAPPELDDSWRFANLMEVVGVKWERF